MKRFLSCVMCLILVMASVPSLAFARSNQMNEGVPVWTEETVRQYALDYIAASDMTRLWNYYDLQIRRYIPQQAFETFLIDLEFLTGDFIALGSYRCFEEPEHELKTHVLHLCMEKLDIDMYFTHKDKEEDWEVMALEFVPSEEESIADEGMDVLEIGSSETVVTVGTNEYPLEGLLTMPHSASAQSPVPACVFVHDFGAYDRDLTLGNTTMFKDFAEELAEMGIASVRYDKRSYAYPEAQSETVWEEVVEDALTAVELLKRNEYIDTDRIVVIGLGMGAILSPRIAMQSDGGIAAMIMIGGVPDSLLEAEFNRSEEYLNSLTAEERDNEKYIMRNFDNYNDEKVRELTLLGKNAYYYREAEEYPQIRTIQKLGIPVFIAQGKLDPVVNENDGRRAYQTQLGNLRGLELETFRGLNHLLMNDLTTDTNGAPLYEIETHVDKQTARALAHWILALDADEE